MSLALETSIHLVLSVFHANFIGSSTVYNSVICIKVDITALQRQDYIIHMVPQGTTGAIGGCTMLVNSACYRHSEAQQSTHMQNIKNKKDYNVKDNCIKI